MSDFRTELNIDDKNSGNTEKLLTKIAELLEECKNELIQIKNKP